MSPVAHDPGMRPISFRALPLASEEQDVIVTTAIRWPRSAGARCLFRRGSPRSAWGNKLGTWRANKLITVWVDRCVDMGKLFCYVAQNTSEITGGDGTWQRKKELRRRRVREKAQPEVRRRGARQRPDPEAQQQRNPPQKQPGNR